MSFSPWQASVWANFEIKTSGDLEFTDNGPCRSKFLFARDPGFIGERTDSFLQVRDSVPAT
jgi:hypothetical protein